MKTEEVRDGYPVLIFESIEEYKSYFGSDPDGSVWDSKGRPYCYVPVESEIIDGAIFTVQEDHGYGVLRLLRNGVQIAVGRHYIIPAGYPDCPEKLIILSVHYYGVHKWIWT